MATFLVYLKVNPAIAIPIGFALDFGIMYLIFKPLG